MSFCVIALISPWAHGFAFLRKLFGIADSESVWIRKGDEHLSRGANRLRVVYPLKDWAVQREPSRMKNVSWHCLCAQPGKQQGLVVME